jgi:hypothetical protein
MAAFREHGCKMFIEERMNGVEPDKLRERMRDAIAAAIDAGYSEAEIEGASWKVAAAVAKKAEQPKA